MTFGIRKLLAIVAAYGVWLAVLSPFGTVGIIGAVWCGTTTSAIVIIARRRDLGPIVRATIGGLVGAALGIGCLSPVLLAPFYTFDRDNGETVQSNIAGAVIGTIAGALLLSLTARECAPPRKGLVMPIHDPRWDLLSDADWDAFARAWVAELDGRPPEPLPALPVLFTDEPETTASDFVVPMNFTESPEAQWRFIVSAFRHADDAALGHLAARPVEHLLSKHGEEYIGQVEAMATEDPRFARMLRGCYQHLMSDDVWARVCALRERA